MLEEEEEEAASKRKRARVPQAKKKRRRTTAKGAYVSANGFASSTDNIEEGEFFRSDGGSSSSGDDAPSLFRVRPSSTGESSDSGAEGVAMEDQSPLDTFCFGCMWGHRQFDRVASEKLNRLAEIFDTHFLTSESRELAHLLHLYYQAEIYNPGLKSGKRFPRWTEDRILIHIEEHILEPRVFVAKSIRKCIKVQRALEMFFFEEVMDPETRNVQRTYNEKAMRLWLMFNKRQMDLHGCDYKNMFGYSENMRIDPTQLSRVVHEDRYAVG